jgi:hypothetical protein
MYAQVQMPSLPFWVAYREIDCRSSAWVMSRMLGRWHLWAVRSAESYGGPYRSQATRQSGSAKPWKELNPHLASFVHGGLHAHFELSRLHAAKVSAIVLDLVSEY